MLHVLCPCFLSVIDPSLSQHLSDLSSLTSTGINFNRLRQGMFHKGQTEETTVTFSTTKSDVTASAAFDSMLRDTGDNDEEEEGLPSTSQDKPRGDGWGPLLTSVNVLPKTTGKGKCIQLADITSVTVKTVSGNNTIVIKGKNGDLLFEGWSGDRIGTEWAVDVMRRCIVHGQERIKGKISAKPTSASRDEGREKMNVVEKSVYFAKREMELAKKKKEATARKEKYLKSAGGLKYTALAMANQK